MNVSRAILFFTVGSSFVAAVAVAADPPGKPRALPPQWSAADKDIFFDDARKELQGPRPTFAAQANIATSGGNAPVGESGGSTSYEWSNLITAETIESEIKRMAQQVSPLVKSASTFKGGAYRDARNHFSTLAIMFGTAAEYDKPVRWKDSASGLAQLFARAGFNCKVGTDQSFREAQLRDQDLADLIRGGRPDVPAADPDAGWDKLSDRSPLMVRMETALNSQLNPNMSDARSFERNSEDLAHEAQMLALLGELITREGMEDAGDETYDGYAHQLRDAAIEFNKSIELESYDAARKALSDMGQSCVACHSDYRS